ncbi:glycoside hydrolase family 13 protein [Nakamurella endophytica]|uniref:Glucohydrolase n=1 Tax=Nakamurella endophytica TaxID=1748367 RepID=A0A917SMY2_9ACTN|nr:alpha-glucosidase [Nakamurella endophytica]GGL89960.1 glucohydrolase [Nakamurella endophytica]
MDAPVQDQPDAASPWWRRAVVYQVYPASFADADGDGFGDLRGVIDHLDHLVDLGIDVLWLSPIYPTPWDDGGYDISDYQDVEPRFGTLEIFDELLREAHRRGLKVVLDLVANHTSDEHPWFVDSASAVDAPRRDWYHWAPPRPGHVGGEPGAEPTNWLSEFLEPAWQFHPGTGEYYLHLYSRKQPDLNWENPEVRQALYAMMRWWLDRGVDGFRMDVINKISKRMPLRDVPPVAGEPYVRARSEYVNGPRVHEFVQEMHREALAPYGARLITVGETSGVTVEEAQLFTGADRGELDMVFTFEHIRFDNGRNAFDKLPFDLVQLKAVMTRWQDGLADVGWNSLYFNNHDQPRVVSRWGDDGEYRVRSAKAFATALHLQRGTPYVYQGEEIGMTNYPFAVLTDLRDIQSLNYSVYAAALGETEEATMAAIREMGRDNARTPMQWDDGPSAGFSTAVPWLPVNPNAAQVNVAAARVDPDSVLAHYRELIRLRHELPVITDGRYRLQLPDHPQLWVFTRTSPEDELLVVVNLSGQEVELPPEARWPGASTVLSTVPGEQGSTAQPWEARVLRRVPVG